MEELGIYIHIPFCKKKCGYCDFYSVPGDNQRLMDDYLSALIRQFKESLISGPAAYNVNTVYIGGGTPSFFGGKRVEKLLKELQKHITLKKGAEVTVEVNPESCDKKLFKRLKDAGVNRVSMGVQSADDKQLMQIGRLHNFERAKEAVELCRQYCTDNISLDLIYGLPGQSMESWKESIERTVELSPKHLSCYALKLEEGTPMYKNPPVDLPDDDMQADMYLYAVDRLKECGFEQYEISNFAKQGYKARHNSKYWDLSPYLGFGAGAHSYFGGKRFSFVRDIHRFIEGKDIVDEADEVAFTMRQGEYVMLKLRTCDGIDEQEFYHRFKADFAPYGKRLDKYIESGHVLHDRGVYKLTPKGFLVSNVIIGDALEAAAMV